MAMTLAAIIGYRLALPILRCVIKLIGYIIILAVGVTNVTRRSSRGIPGIHNIIPIRVHWLLVKLDTTKLQTNKS